MSKKNIEKSRLIYTLLISIFLGLISGYYQLFIILGLLSYSIWMLVNLTNFYNWLLINANPNKSPYIYGTWDNIISYILKQKKQIANLKKKHQKLIIRFNEILRSLPYPTIVVNTNNEITWISKDAANLLKLHRKKDIGIRINNIIRDENFSKKLIKKESSEQIMTINNLVLEVAISKINKDTRILNIKNISKEYSLAKNQTTFMANASHELRTPLTIVGGYLQMLLDSKDTDKNFLLERQNIIADAYLETQKMNNLINDLLTLLEIENNTKQAQTTIIINDIIIEVEKYINKTYPLVKITKNIDTNLTIKSSYQNLYSLVLNLIENAAKYANNHISIDLLKADVIQLTIKDNGCGISEVDLSKITEPFFRTQKIRASGKKGSGLGLAIVKQITDKNNWQLKTKSVLNQGSEFMIIFGK